jgi:hypothetical protein
MLYFVGYFLTEAEMISVPEKLSTTWIRALSNTDLVDVEEKLHARLAVLERREKAARGVKYDLLRSPADVLDAWNRWSRVNNATRERSLNPRRVR